MADKQDEMSGGVFGSVPGGPALSEEPQVRDYERRETALQELKRQLAETSIAMPCIEGYQLRKARKILDLVGFPLDRLRIKYVENSETKNQVIQQSPRPGESIDLQDPRAMVDVQVADINTIQYLPSIYQRNDISGRNFLYDFLWVFQHIFNETEEKLTNIHTYFDPLETPSDFLPWLSSWVAMVLEEDWPEFRKRNLIKKAVELYQVRGTLRGLRLYLKIFTGVHPIIHENHWPFEGITVGIRSTCGENTILMHYVDLAHCFTCELPMTAREVEAKGPDFINKIHRIIEREKPAHTTYWVTFKPEEEEEEGFGWVVGESKVGDQIAGD